MTEKTELGAFLHHLTKLIEETKTKESEQSLVLTVTSAAKMMEISIPTLRDHFLGRPDFPKIWAGSKCLIPRKALMEWLNGAGLDKKSRS
jgi:hypothetical protein